MGLIQPHGVLLAADPADDLALVAASANADEFGIGADVLTRSLPDLLGVEFAQTLAHRARTETLTPADPLEAMITLDGAPGHFEVACHAHDGLVLIELEPAKDEDVAVATSLRSGLRRAFTALREEAASNDIATEAAAFFRAITGYERVIVYRFDPDWHGVAAAEDRVDDWDHSLLGLHFPATDIPVQARALYARSPIRWTVSRDAPTVPVLLAPGRSGRPIDLSHARLRALSAAHMAYHRDLGVDGAMSISLMDGPELWGLVICHHRGPHRTTAAQREAASILASTLAVRLVAVERAAAHDAASALRRRCTSLIAHLTQVDELQVALTSGPTTLRDLFDVPGAAIVQGDTVTLLGATPSRADVLRLATHLRAAPRTETPSVFATAHLAGVDPAWTAHAEVASGLLAAFLDDARTDMLLWFRPEEPSLIGWGGNPRAPVGPRRSFERWQELRRGYASVWTTAEIESAGMVQHAITDVIVRNHRRIATLNEQLRQNQRMEAVGQLTGGLAHDFNNLLGGITGAIELAQSRLARGRSEDAGKLLTAALGASARAAALTHRLLAFSRRQTLDPRPTDLTRLLAAFEDRARNTIPAAIAIRRTAASDLWPILCDPSQLENALLNLVLNACEAMPAGGTLAIMAANARLDDAAAVQFGIQPGDYVDLSIIDAGPGMPPDTAARAFEPFFTTKALGQGTGLGLSMVYGFAKQSGGHAHLRTAPGEGTAVHLILPRHDGPMPAAIPSAEATAGLATHTVLVVDDEPVLRMLVCEVLREQGLTVLEAANGSQAMSILTSGRPLDLLLSDVGLPGGMNGRQVVDAARVLLPLLKVLFITGYAENAALADGILDGQTQVLTKPFGMQALVRKVQDMLP